MRFRSPALGLILAAALCASQAAERNRTALVKEVHFTGDLGIPVGKLREYTEFLLGHRLEQRKLLKDASSAVGEALRHRGYLKAQVTPLLRPLQSSGSNDAEFVLEIDVEAGKQYSVKDLLFVGLSGQLAERDLKEACDLRTGQIADGEHVRSCMTNLRTLFQRKGQNVSVVPSMAFADAASTVSIQFDVEK